MPIKPCISFFSDKITSSCLPICQRIESLGTTIAGFTIFIGSALMPRDSLISSTFAIAVMCFGLLVMAAGVEQILRHRDQESPYDAADAVINQL